MISVLLLGFDQAGRGVAAAEDAVATLASLVPATVDGIVRDLCLAAPDNKTLADVSDHAGCGFLPAATVRDAIRTGARRLRCPMVLVTRCGAVLERPVLDELSALLPMLSGTTDFHRINAVRDDLLGRLFPGTAPTIALLAPRAWLETVEVASFDALIKRARPARALRSRIWLRR